MGDRLVPGITTITVIFLLCLGNEQPEDQTGNKSADLEGGMTEVSTREGI